MDTEATGYKTIGQYRLVSIDWVGVVSSAADFVTGHNYDSCVCMLLIVKYAVS